MKVNPVTNPVLLRSIQVGQPRTVQTPNLAVTKITTWSTGFFKQPVNGPVWLGKVNLKGDGQADLQHHGGIHKAVCVYPEKHYPVWQTELSLKELSPGAFGENFTLVGLTEADVCIGDVFEVGAAIVEVSQPRQPCWKLARRWQIKDLAYRVQETGRTGWYFRVRQEGLVQAGQPLTMIERPHPEWTISRANQLMHHEKSNRDQAALLAELPALSPNWKATLRKRARTQTEPDENRRLQGDSE